LPLYRLHEKHGVPCFTKVVAGLITAKELGENVRAQFTVTEESIQYLPETAKLTRSIGVPLHVLPVFSYFGNEGLSDKTAKELFNMNLPGVRMNPAAMRFHRSGGNNPQNPRCYAGRSSFALSPTGELLLPCFHQHKGSISTLNGLKNTYYSEQSENLKKLAGRMDCCRGCTNWCYINPSFLMKPDIYCLLHSKFAIGNIRHIFGLHPGRVVEAWQGFVQRKCPRLVK
jgi:MoaA/NifB/PqqE/SkfB family radical SAM enzyme